MKGDDALSFLVKKALAKDMELSALDIRVNTLNGVVHLDGVVDVLGDKEYAEKVIREIDGVQDIVNRLSIGMERQVKDDEMTHAVEDRLIDKNPDYRRIGVAAKKGVVHLYGEVNNLHEEKEVLSTAMDIKGVREVVSHLKLHTSDRFGYLPDDATVHNSVRYMLATNADVDRGALEVEVRNGKVTLRGRVDTVEDKQIAGKLASMAEGVRNVINELHVTSGGTGGNEGLEALIRREWGRDPEVSPQQVRVYVEDKMVFLDGTVYSPEVKDAALRVVQRVLRDVGNIEGVHDGIVISGALGSVQKGHDKDELGIYQ